MENLLEISEPEVRINFILNSKCRYNLMLRSLCPAFPVAFKVQTSSPHKFLVNPPSGLVPPLSQVALQIVLKPQDQIPPTFPRSHSDRFLIRTALFDLDSGGTAHSDSVDSCLSARPTHDIKLKVAFVGPFLLHHAVSCGNLEIVRKMIKRQKSVLYDLSTREAESLLQVATQLANSEDMVNLLLEAGLRTASRGEEEDGHDAGFYQLDPRWESKGWTELHVAVAFDRTEELVELLRKGRREPLDWRDKEGRTPLHLAASKGNIECAKILVESGVDKNAKSKDGRTALFRAAANGNRRMVEMLIELDADPTIPDDRGRSAFDIARDKGHPKICSKNELTRTWHDHVGRNGGDHGTWRGSTDGSKTGRRDAATITLAKRSRHEFSGPIWTHRPACSGHKRSQGRGFAAHRIGVGLGTSGQ
ncbi:PREDICTED: serine/threonine-protein phosphatase 6 regulatory ankyrin repeat subunit C isoform X2 [Theobroma cacao]|uniref:Serine/threonine-protein phosphatase 6 regulatory ankyrin repeat subunit C isoform X2 n=1 Tax=Theobroma cacao TaxID=3641 RepID=A0AB32UL79_THECC|nr:PREDICTED: serine/threonine-protein phosphatase 6 regulatory ankyrin repeat subunit C isoform X2 [Theobroma cacao]